MFCRKCGNELKEDDVFCNKCGTKVELTENTIQSEDNNIESNDNNKKSNGNFKYKVKWVQVLFYTILCDIFAIFITIVSGIRIINFVTILFTIFGFFGGLMNSMYVIGICPHCNKK